MGKVIMTLGGYSKLRPFAKKMLSCTGCIEANLVCCVLVTAHIQLMTSSIAHCGTVACTRHSYFDMTSRILDTETVPFRPFFYIVITYIQYSSQLTLIPKQDVWTRMLGSHAWPDCYLELLFYLFSGQC
jgi:hypothetical protein